MGEYDDTEVTQIQEELKLEKLKNLEATNQNIKSSMFSNPDIINIVQWQLDLSEEKEKIDHLLRGHIIKRMPDGNEHWVEPEDYRMRSLTNYGVEQLMNIINFYLSRNNILSFYTEEQIQEKMLAIGEELADKMYNEYEYFFYTPSILDFVKRSISEIKKIGDNCKSEEDISEMAVRIYKAYKEEAEEIRIKNLKAFPMIHQLILNQIHAAFNRALRGEERESLRKFMHISLSDNISKQQSPYPTVSGGRHKFKITRPSTWNMT